MSKKLINKGFSTSFTWPREWISI